MLLIFYQFLSLRLLNQFINIINANDSITKMLNKLLINNRLSIKQ